MSRPNEIPLYSADGTPQGFRTLEFALGMIAKGDAKPSYGRKKQLRAIWLTHMDGGTPVEAGIRQGSKYVHLERLPQGHRCWRHKRLDLLDANGVVAGRDDFLRVVADRMR